MNCPAGSVYSSQKWESPVTAGDDATTEWAMMEVHHSMIVPVGVEDWREVMAEVHSDHHQHTLGLSGVESIAGVTRVHLGNLQLFQVPVICKFNWDTEHFAS